jgi:hypothetical protein
VAQSGLRPSPGERAIWDEIITTIRGQLGDDGYHTAWDVGRTLPLAALMVEEIRRQSG